MNARKMPVITWKMNDVSTALPKTYHQFTLFGTGWKSVAFNTPPTPRRSSSHRYVPSPSRIKPFMQFSYVVSGWASVLI